MMIPGSRQGGAAVSAGPAKGSGSVASFLKRSRRCSAGMVRRKNMLAMVSSRPRAGRTVCEGG